MSDDYRVRLTADNDITAEAKEAAEALDQIPDKVDVDISADASQLDRVLGAFDEVTAEAGRTKEAADELARALGPELSAQADTTRIVGELQKMGLTLDDVKANADQLGAKLKEAADADVGGSLGASLGTARGKIDEVSDSARGANSALANMVGNSVQDLGALGGVAGSLGVGLGQMGEYAADAAFGGEKLTSALGSMVKVAGPIAGIALAVQLLSTAMAKGERSAELQAEGIERVTEAAEEGTGVIGALHDQIEETGKLEFRLGGGFDFAGIGVENLLDNLDKVNLQVRDFAQFIGEDATRSLEDYYQANKDILGTNGDWVALFAARDALNKQVAESEAARALAARVGADDEAASAEVVTDAYDKVIAAQEEAGRAAEEHQRKQEADARAFQEYAVKVGTAENALSDLAGAFSRMASDGEALSTVFDLGNAPLDLAGQTRDIALAIGELSDAAKDVDLSQALDPSNLDADGLLDALDGLRPQIQTKISEAFASGGPVAAQQTAEFYVQSIVNELGGKLSAEEVANLLNLSDIQATITAAVEQSSIDKARRQLEILTGVTGETPYTASIALALDAGTITGDQAQALIQERLAGAGVEVPAELAVDLTDAEKVVDGFVDEERSTTPVDLEANSRPADDVAKDFVDEKRTTTPVEIAADDFKAAAVALAFLTLRRSTTIDILANPFPAALTLASFLSQRRTAEVDFVIGSVPSQSDIRRRIGNVTVPVDITIGQSVRITGVRD